MQILVEKKLKKNNNISVTIILLLNLFFRFSEVEMGIKNCKRFSF